MSSDTYSTFRWAAETLAWDNLDSWIEHGRWTEELERVGSWEAGAAGRRGKRWNDDKMTKMRQTGEREEWGDLEEWRDEKRGRVTRGWV